MNYSNLDLSCKNAEPYYYDFIEKDAHNDIPANVIEHIQICSHCLRRLAELKQTLSGSQSCDKQLLDILEQQFSHVEKPLRCNIVKPFFASLLQKQIKIPTPITLHLEKCDQCNKDLQAIKSLPLDDIQMAGLSAIFTEKDPHKQRKLITSLTFEQKSQEILLDIAQRTDSEVVTVYHINDYAKNTKRTHFSDLPVKVQKSAQLPFVKQIYSKLSLRHNQFFKIAMASAAVIMAGVMLFHTSSAKAISYEQIAKAIEKTKNVYIAKYNAEKLQQEIWISKSLNVYLKKTGDQGILWDMSNRITKIKHIDNTIEASVISQEALNELKITTSGSLGLLPFHRISDIPANSQWNKINKQDLHDLSNQEIYELTWNDVTGHFWKWFVYVDPETDLPQRTECYLQITPVRGFQLQSSYVIKYLSDSQITGILRDFSD